MRPLRSVLLAAALLCPNLARADEAHLVLLHTTDIHGHLFAEGSSRGGLVRVATLVREARADSLPTLLLDAGDALHGSLFARGARAARPAADPVVATMNALGFDASVVGNHEFDGGLAALDGLRAQARFPFLAANLERADAGPPFAPALVRTVGGIRVGIVGLCTPALASISSPRRLGGVRAGSAVDAARREVTRLRDREHCDVVVLLAHTGLGVDARTGAPHPGDVADEQVGEALARDVPRVDVVILGHSHVVIPELVRGDVIVAQAGKYAEGLGRIDLTLTRGGAREPWRVSERHGRFLAVRDSTPADPALEARLAGDRRAADAELDRVVGRTARALTAPVGRAADNPVCQMLNEVQRDFTGAQVSMAAMFDATASLPAGEVRLRDVLALYPYENTLVTLRVSGADLRQALEHSAAQLAPYTFEPGAPLFEPDAQGWNFDMAAGVTYRLDPSAGPGNRIVELAREGRPIAPGDSLTLAVNSYRAAGGGGFAMLARAPRLAESEESLPDLIAIWLAKRGVAEPSAERSWALQPMQAGRPERALLDRLVRLGSLPAAEARTRDLDAPAYGARAGADLGRALGWRAGRPGGNDDEAWLAGLERHKVLRTSEATRTRTLTLGIALEWCERAARAARWPLASRSPDAAYRRGLLTGIPALTDPVRDADVALDDGQWLAILANFRWPELRVLETTDFHGAILPGTDRRSNRPTGGSVALAAAVESERAANPEGSVLLDGGDCFQGTMISNLEYGRPVVEQMNALRYAATAVGNHEFDWTIDTLVARVRGMHFAALAANMLERRSGRRPGWARADTSFVRRGVRVGVVGLAYPGTPRVTLPANVTTLRFEDDSTWAARIAPRLRREGAAVVLGVGHIPAETDSTRKARGDLAAARPRGARRGRLVRGPQPQRGRRRDRRHTADDRRRARPVGRGLRPGRGSSRGPGARTPHPHAPRVGRRARAGLGGMAGTRAAVERECRPDRGRGARSHRDRTRPRTPGIARSVTSSRTRCGGPRAPMWRSRIPVACARTSPRARSPAARSTR